ncbi:PREDICTED: DNA-directed RNA polymerase I subunit RPA43 isoform X2 [Trachymyrmex cornetzi]|uniref:DNA-directed RNA polymerase I subunit RPA43 isoform X2 n=1 Tax=Trachymyrmex cornetzi TaxID=471704 RepID=UPI00084F3B82|nr:PREDICTED: DNA-directed RNA polymerase I subunit RPA43 isoform X2 [Trachymyrmex cornetzi]
MKHQKNREVTWTILELRGFLEDEDSHVHFVRTIKHIALHPYYLNNIQRGLNQILRSLLNTYDRELKGFVLAFKNPKLLSNLGELFYDSPFIHVDIEADFYLFRPKAGSFLKDNTEQWLGESVEIGQEIRCCVTQLHHKSKPPFICASLKSDYSQGCRLSESIININDVDSAPESTNNSMKIDIDGILENDGISEKEKKKQKKHWKKHKFQERNSEVVCKIENESKLNVGSNTSTIIKSEKKQQCILLNIGVDSVTESINNSMKIDIDGILENDGTSEKEKKKQKKHRKEHKFQERNSEVVCKIENESELNVGSNISTIIKSEKKQQCILLNIGVDGATESTNNFMKIDIDGILKNDDISEKEKKKQKKHWKEHKFQERNSEVVCKIENESELNVGSNTSTIINLEKKQQCILLNTDDSLNNLKVDNIPRKYKKNKKTSKSLLNNETILDEFTESRKAAKRKNSILLDSITETETKKEKKCEEI